MTCPKCSGVTNVLDTRESASRDTQRRVRECLVCKYRFSTLETILRQVGTAHDSGVKADRAFFEGKIRAQEREKFANRLKALAEELETK